MQNLSKKPAAYNYAGKIREFNSQSKSRSNIEMWTLEWPIKFETNWEILKLSLVSSFLS